MLDYALHQADYRSGDAPALTVHWGSVAGVVLGALAGNFLPIGIASINAIIAACLCYLLAERLVYSKR